MPSPFFLSFRPINKLLKGEAVLMWLGHWVVIAWVAHHELLFFYVVQK